MTSAVDHAIEDAVTKRLLPKYKGSLLSAKMIEGHVTWSEWTPYHDSGIFRGRGNLHKANGGVLSHRHGGGPRLRSTPLLRTRSGVLPWFGELWTIH
jgi:hypothetical protein